MSAASLARGEWQRRSVAGVLGLAALSPLFAWAAAQTGYAEPMDEAVALAGMTAEAVPTSVSLLPGYTTPGAGPHLGTLGAALAGTLLTFAVAVGLARLLAPDR
jgi:cobalt/nickel transport protein